MRKQLHVISTGQQTIQEFIEIAKNIHPYVDVFHIREKKWSASEMLQAITLLKENGISYEKIMVNDWPELSYSMSVKGVQLPKHSIDISLVKEMFPSIEIGASVHSFKEAEEAYSKGADLLLYGNVFPTDSKVGMSGKGLAKLEEIVQSVSIPVIAIGGIKPVNISSVLKTGVSGVALLSGILLSKDPLSAAISCRNTLNLEGEII